MLFRSKIGNSLGVVLLSGCTAFVPAGTPLALTPEGRAVQVVTPDIAKACEKLGPVASWQSVSDGGLASAQNDVRNRVARRGGNALVTQVVNVEQPQPHAEVIAQAFHCAWPDASRTAAG